METPKIALVSGGTRGIGRHTCLQLAEKGFKVFLTYRSNEEMANNVVAEIIAANCPIPYAFKCDMTDTKAVKSLVTMIRKEYGEISVLVNNAGVLGTSKPFIMTKDEEWWYVLNTNIACVMNTCRAVIPSMMRQKKGSIINVTSLSGQRGNAGQSAYAASKAAIVAFSKTVHKEMGAFGVTINCISPGLIRTDMTKDIKPEYYEKRLANSPLKRMGEPEEVANLITYIATSAPSYLIGQEITIDGGIGV
jgi:NAD(P)-dependent dehydrogenase (short-subunit alcohol dehydrogenase family)